MPTKRAQPDRVLLPVKVVAGSSRDGIAGWLGDALKVRVSAPAERGRANAAVVAVVADALAVPRACVRVVKGTPSPRKMLEVRGLTEAQLRERLAQRAGPAGRPPTPG